MLAELGRQYHVMFENMAQGAFFQLADGSLVDVNPAALEIFGLSCDQFLGRTSYDPAWEVITEDGTDLPPDQHPSMAALRTGQQVRDVIAGVYNPTKKSYVWMVINAIPMFREGDSSPYQVFVTLHDITAHKRLDDIHLSRLHLTQFAQSHTLKELLVEALDQMEKLTGSLISFYHFYDAESQRLTLTEWSSRTTPQFCWAVGRGNHSGDPTEGWLDCLQTGEPVIHNDYASLPHRQGLPNDYEKIARELLVPVKRQERIVAILGVGNKPHEYTDTDVSTALLFGDLIWDIVERKRFEQLQQQATRQYNVLTNTSTDGCWVVDGTGRIVSVNDTICHMYGYSREELLTKSLRHFDALENDEQMRAHTEKIITEGYDRFETQHIRKDGSTIHVEVSTAYMPESGIFLAFIRDITERKQNEEALKESELKFRTLFATIQDAIFLTTNDGKIIECNEQLSGYSRSELLGNTTVELGLWANMDERQQVVDAVTVKRYVNDFEATFRRKDGTVYLGSISTNAVRLGDRTYLLSVVRDITERKQAEDEIRRLNADLHRLIKERTMELTQTNRDLSSFCYAISHELRAPVARLKGLSQALCEDFAEDPATAAHCAERIVVASDQLQRVIDSVLQLTRLSHVSFTRQPISVSSLAREIVNGLLIDVPERQVEVVIADGLAATADLPLVRLCLINLIGNALKYSAGRPVARIEIGLDGASGALCVRDNGVGFDMAHADKIFEPFMRLHSEAEFAGTGIGLATVQRIIERHGGRIWADATPGRGATFYFTLEPVQECLA
jgi:PAS domain S-box-containing protein